MSTKLKTALIRQLEQIPGIEGRPSRVAGGASLFFRGKEIAHFHNDHEIDVRLTRRIIRAEGLKHPGNSDFHAGRSASSEWFECRFHSASQVDEVVRLFKLAIDSYRRADFL